MVGVAARVAARVEPHKEQDSALRRSKTKHSLLLLLLLLILVQLFPNTEGKTWPDVSIVLRVIEDS